MLSLKGEWRCLIGRQRDKSAVQERCLDWMQKLDHRSRGDTPRGAKRAERGPMQKAKEPRVQRSSPGGGGVARKGKPRK